MKSELRAEVYKVYQSYLDAFNREDMDGINACIEFPLTHIGNGKINVLDKFPLSPTEMKKAKGWHRSDSFEIDIVAHDRNQGASVVQECASAQGRRFLD